MEIEKCPHYIWAPKIFAVGMAVCPCEREFWLNFGVGKSWRQLQEAKASVETLWEGRGGDAKGLQTQCL